jgi:hypothetical protein
MCITPLSVIPDAQPLMRLDGGAWWKPVYPHEWLGAPE